MLRPRPPFGLPLTQRRTHPRSYAVPYVLFVVWLDAVTYLHHHGSSDPTEKMPWYRWGFRAMSPALADHVWHATGQHNLCI